MEKYLKKSILIFIYAVVLPLTLSESLEQPRTNNEKYHIYSDTDLIASPQTQNSRRVHRQSSSVERVKIPARTLTLPLLSNNDLQNNLINSNKKSSSITEFGLRKQPINFRKNISFSRQIFPIKKNIKNTSTTMLKRRQKTKKLILTTENPIPKKTRFALARRIAGKNKNYKNLEVLKTSETTRKVVTSSKSLSTSSNKQIKNLVRPKFNQPMNHPPVHQNIKTLSPINGNKKVSNYEPNVSANTFQPVEIDEGGVNYSFSYSVNDEKTKDIKSHRESRIGDKLEGEYMLLDPDGYTRVVTYSYDPVNGFIKKVKRFLSKNQL